MNLIKQQLTDRSGKLILDLGQSPNWEAETVLELICQRYNLQKHRMNFFDNEIYYDIPEATWTNDEFWKQITLWQLTY